MPLTQSLGNSTVAGIIRQAALATAPNFGRDARGLSPHRSVMDNCYPEGFDWYLEHESRCRCRFRTPTPCLLIKVFATLYPTLQLLIRRRGGLYWLGLPQEAGAATKSRTQGYVSNSNVASETGLRLLSHAVFSTRPKG